MEDKGAGIEANKIRFTKGTESTREAREQQTGQHNINDRTRNQKPVNHLYTRQTRKYNDSVNHRRVGTRSKANKG